MISAESPGRRSDQSNVTAGLVGAGLPALTIPAPATRLRGQLKRRQAGAYRLWWASVATADDPEPAATRASKRNLYALTLRRKIATRH